MNLIIEYFNSLNHMRNGEFLYCLHENLGNEYIKNVYVFMEEDAELNFDSPKIKRVVRNSRPTYKELFDFCNENHSGEICVVANADIIFDDTLRYFNGIDMSKTFYALSRWEISTGDGKNWEIEPYNNAASQDSWIFRAPIATSEDMKAIASGFYDPAKKTKAAALIDDVKKLSNVVRGLSPNDFFTPRLYNFSFSIQHL